MNSPHFIYNKEITVILFLILKKIHLNCSFIGNMFNSDCFILHFHTPPFPPVLHYLLVIEFSTYHTKHRRNCHSPPSPPSSSSQPHLCFCGSISNRKASWMQSLVELARHSSKWKGPLGSAVHSLDCRPLQRN